MPERLRKTVTVTRRACQGIGRAACAQNYLLAGNQSACCFDCGNSPLLCQKRGNRLLPALHAEGVHLPFQNRDNICRAIGARKYAVAAFNLERAAVFFKKSHRPFGRKGGNAAE